jgi:hypothetical protein
MRTNRTLLLRIVHGGAASATVTRHARDAHLPKRRAPSAPLEPAPPTRADAHEALLRAHRIVQPFELG